MNRICLSFLALAALSGPTRGQKVEAKKTDRGQIVHVETAMDHLTVLEMSEPIISVAIGCPAFKVEWRGNKVFIEPTGTNVATNLFVWTASGRFNYELDPAGAVPQMDFAIDQSIVDPPTVSISKKAGTKSNDPWPANALMQAKPVHLYGSILQKNRVAVYLTDLVEDDRQVFVRYTIRNGTKKAYVPGAPQVAVLNAPRYRESLYSLANSQLGPNAAARLKSAGETTLEVAKGDIRSSRIEPGEETTEVIAIQLPLAHIAPTVLRLTFLADRNGSVNAVLVL